MLNSKYIPADTAIAIIDFDNFIEDNDSILNAQDEFNLMINMVLSKIIDEDVSHLFVRFYGGWFSEGVLSRRGSLLRQRLASNSFFPIRKNDKNYHGEIELASSLNVLHDFTFNNTHRVKNGLPNIRLDKQHLGRFCVNENKDCPARILDKFTRKKDKVCGVSDCNVVNQDAYKHRDQKMVDTMMAIDIVDFGEHPNVNKIVLFSNDTDLLPSVIRCKFKDNKIKVVASQSTAIESYKELESRFSFNLLIP